MWAKLKTEEKRKWPSSLTCLWSCLVCPRQRSLAGTRENHPHHSRPIHDWPLWVFFAPTLGRKDIYWLIGLKRPWQKYDAQCRDLEMGRNLFRADVLSSDFVTVPTVPTVTTKFTEFTHHLIVRGRSNVGPQCIRVTASSISGRGRDWGMRLDQSSPPTLSGDVPPSGEENWKAWLIWL